MISTPLFTSLPYIRTPLLHLLVAPLTILPCVRPSLVLSSIESSWTATLTNFAEPTCPAVPQVYGGALRIRI